MGTDFRLLSSIKPRWFCRILEAVVKMRKALRGMGDMPMTSLIIEGSGAVLPNLKGIRDYLNVYMSNHSKYILPRRLFDDESLKRNTHTPLETFAIGAASDHAQATHRCGSVHPSITISIYVSTSASNAILSKK